MNDLIRREDAIEAICKARTPDVVSHQYAELFINAVCRAPSADRPQEWIPCSERLPKIGEYHHISEPCIVYCKCGAYAFAELEENIFGQVGWNCERDDDYHEPIGEVLAWMPLPPVYEGD